MIDSLATKELEVKCGRGFWWLVRIRPYRTTDNKIDGAVIAVFDIDALKNDLQLSNHGRAVAEALVNTTRHPMVALDKDLAVRFINPAFCRVFNVKAEQTFGRPFYHLADGQWDLPQLHRLLEDILPHQATVEDFELEQEVPGLGRRRLRFTAQRLAPDGSRQAFTVLAIEVAEAQPAT